MKKLIFILLFFGTKQLHSQQLNLPNYDFKKKIRFGFTLAATSNDFKYNTSDAFKNMDTLRHIGVQRFPGLTIGGIMCLKMTDRWELRLTPSLSLAQRNIVYNFDNPIRDKIVKIESVYTEFPLLFKYKTKRHQNVRFYLLGGVKFIHDFGSEVDAVRSINRPVVALLPNTFNYEVGFGFDLYLEFFKFSPEIKLSNSFGSVLSKDQYVYSQAFQGLYSRVLMLSFCFE